MAQSSPIPELDDEYFVFVPGRLTKDHVLCDTVLQDPPSRLQKDQSAQLAKSPESTESEESSESTESAESTESKHLEEGQAEWIDALEEYYESVWEIRTRINEWNDDS